MRTRSQPDTYPRFKAPVFLSPERATPNHSAENGRVCGRGRHLMRVARRDGFVAIDGGADLAAISPALVRGFVEPIGRDRYAVTVRGADFLDALARVE